jgi:hypothetical protein
MLFEYTLVCFLVSFLGLLLCFDEGIDPVGRVFFMLLAGVFLPIAGYGLFSVDYNWGGSINVVQYTYHPIDNTRWIPYGFAIVGALLIIIAVAKSTQLVTKMIPATKDLKFGEINIFGGGGE